MILIIGLGNPEEKYLETRHNIGFEIANKFLITQNTNKNNNDLTFKSFSNWKKNKNFFSEISKGKINNQEIIIAKPQTFINNSGKAVKALITKNKTEITNLYVIHDDIDLPIGTIKIVKNRGSAGHKGIESIIKEIKNKNFIRFRIGIKPTFGKPKNADKFVLQKFNQQEKEIIKEIIQKIIIAIEETIKKGLEKAMNEFN